MNKETLTRMQQMKLYGMHLAFKTVVEQNGAPGLTPDQLVGHLVDAEYDDRYNRKTARLLRNARLRYKAVIEEIHFDPHRKLDREQVIRLAEGLYLEKAENILITGSTGAGKSYLACALGHQACSAQHRVMYFSTSRLFSQLKLAKADGSYVKVMGQLQRQQILILDDFGLQPLDGPNSHILLEIVEDRYNIGSLIITSQVPVDQWYDLIPETTVADAVMDRIVHKAHRIELKGESMRKKKAKEEPISYQNQPLHWS